MLLHIYVDIYSEIRNTRINELELYNHIKIILNQQPHNSSSFRFVDNYGEEVI